MAIFNSYVSLPEGRQNLIPEHDQATHFLGGPQSDTIFDPLLSTDSGMQTQMFHGIFFHHQTAY